MSKSKKPSLSSVFAMPTPAPAASDAPQIAPAQASAQPSQTSVAAPAPSASKRPPSREGKRVVSVYLSEEAWKQLRRLGLDLDISTQALGEEAFNLLFEKHRLNRIA